MRKILLFELNEVPFRVLDDFCARHPQSAFATALKTAGQFTARTPDTIYLHPKISWPTFYRGVPDTVHGILEFGQDTTEADRRYPVMWQLIAEKGFTVGLGGSIGAKSSQVPANQLLYYLPDMFAGDTTCKPAQMAVFQDFATAMIKENGRNIKRTIHFQRAFQFMVNAPRLGITPTTVFKTARQLLWEVGKKERLSRRRTVHALLSFDIVYRQIESTCPDLATVFSNNVASSMHRFWAASYPGDYQSLEHEAQWLQAYREEIDFTMSEADACLARLLAFAQRHPQYQVLLMTTMGQQAAEGKPVTNQLLLQQPEKLVALLGFTPQQVAQKLGMVPTYNLQVVPECVELFRERLMALKLNGATIPFDMLGDGFFRLKFHDMERFRNLIPEALTLTLDGKPLPYQQAGFVVEELAEKTGPTGWHVPEGMLLVIDPQRDLSAHNQRQVVSTTEVTAALLQNFDIAPPGYMPPVTPALANCLGQSVPMPSSVSL